MRPLVKSNTNDVMSNTVRWPRQMQFFTSQRGNSSTGDSSDTGRLSNGVHLQRDRGLLDEGIFMSETPYLSYVYFIQAGDESFVKIGKTINGTPEESCQHYQAGNHRKLHVIGAIKISNSKHREANRLALNKKSEIQAMFSGARLNGNWFNLTDEIQSYIDETSNT